MKTYYKVVRKEIDILQSFNALVKDDNPAIIYKVNEWAYPLNGTYGLFLFKTLGDAICMLNSLGLTNHKFRIYKCHAKNVRKMNCINTPYSEEFLNFWKEYKECKAKKKKFMSGQRAPSNSYICDSLKLLPEYCLYSGGWNVSTT